MSPETQIILKLLKITSNEMQSNNLIIWGLKKDKCSKSQKDWVRSSFQNYTQFYTVKKRGIKLYVHDFHYSLSLKSRSYNQIFCQEPNRPSQASRKYYWYLQRFYPGNLHLGVLLQEQKYDCLKENRIIELILPSFCDCLRFSPNIIIWITWKMHESF